MNQLIVGSIAAVCIGAGFLVPRERVTMRQQLPNPCTRPLVDTSYRLDNLRFEISDSSATLFRENYGLQPWHADSVAHTVDSVVCRHIDSLIGVWMATPAAQAEHVSRWPDWPGNLTVRINPHRYFVMPPLIDSSGGRWTFVVDSVSGDVRFLRTTW